MRIFSTIAAVTLALALGACASDDGGQTGNDSSTPGSDATKLFVDADPGLDETTAIRNGPYLNAPSAGTVTLSWTTSAPTTSRVSFGPEGGPQTDVEGVTFKQLPTHAEPLVAGFIPEDFQHEVTLTGLQSGQRYTYTVLSAPDPKPTGTFIGPPDAGDDFIFFLMGDTRTRATEHGQVVQGMVDIIDQEGEAAFVLNSGDLVNAGGNLGDWDGFFATEAPLLSRVPLLPVYGNHEHILGRTVFEGFFKAPPTSTSPSDRWYSVDIGDIHIATVDPYSLDPIVGEDHIAWLESDLAASNAPFKIVSMHPPIFTMSNHLPNFDLRARLMPIFESTGVSMLVTGHNHCYERWFGSGIYLVVTGGGGAPLYGIDDNPGANNDGAIRVAADETIHFIKGTVTGLQIRFEVIDAPGANVIDCFLLDSTNPGADIPCP